MLKINNSFLVNLKEIHIDRSKRERETIIERAVGEMSCEDIAYYLILNNNNNKFVLKIFQNALEHIFLY